MTHRVATNPVKGQRGANTTDDDFMMNLPKLQQRHKNPREELSATYQGEDRGRDGGVLWHSHMVFLWLSSGWLRMTSLQILCASCLHVSVCVCVYCVCLVKPSAWHLEDHGYNEADPSKTHVFLCSPSLFHGLQQAFVFLRHVILNDLSHIFILCRFRHLALGKLAGRSNFDLSC